MLESGLNVPEIDVMEADVKTIKGSSPFNKLFENIQATAFLDMEKDKKNLVKKRIHIIGGILHKSFLSIFTYSPYGV